MKRIGILTLCLLLVASFAWGSGMGGSLVTTYSQVPVIVTAVDRVLTAVECRGSYVEVTAAKTITLAPGSEGMNLLVRSSGANAVNVKPAGSEAIVLNGAALTGGNKITSPGAANDSVTLVHNGTNWIVIGASTWTDGGA